MTKSPLPFTFLSIDLVNITKTIKKQHILFFLLLSVLPSKSYSQKPERISNHSVGLSAGCSILEGSGIRLELPGVFLNSKRHGISFSLAAKATHETPFVMGVSANYLHFIEPAFRDVNFFLLYNSSYFFEEGATITHIFGIGTRIDVGRHGFIQHSVGLGLHQSCYDFCSRGPACQLKLSFGFYLRKISAKNIQNDPK